MVVAFNRHFTSPRTVPDELPPANVEAEAAILGALLMDSNSELLNKTELPPELQMANPWERIKEFRLIPEVFSLPSFQILFEEMTEMNKAGIPTDFLNVSNHLAQKGLLDKVGGQSQLVRLLDTTISSVNIDEYCKLILDKYQRRKIISSTYELQAMAYDPLATFEEMEAKRAEINSYVLMKGVRRGLDLTILDKEMEAIGDEDSIERDLRLKNMAKRWGFGGLREMKDIHARWVLTKMLKPKSFGLREYYQHCQNIKTDWIFPGWIPRGSLVCLYGTGGVGKTRMTHSMTYSLISGEPWGDYEVDGAKRVLVVQADQGDRENHQMLDIQGFYGLSDEQQDRYRVIQNWSTGRLSYLKQEILEHKPDVVVLDSYTTVNIDTTTDENSMRYATPLIHWKRLAQECGCAFIVLHHANKGGGMRGTTAIHNTVDEVWQLAHRTERPNGEVVLSIEKSRSRGPAQYLLKYDPDSWRWNIEGEIEGNDVLGLSDLSKAIKSWLDQTGKKHEIDEIQHAVGGSINTIRKELGWLLKSGLISAERGLSRRKVYFTHLANRTDPIDPTDLEVIQPSGSVRLSSRKPIQTQAPQETQQPAARPQDFKDPVDLAKRDDFSKEENLKNCGSIPEMPKSEFNVGDRVAFNLLSLGAPEIPYYGYVKEVNGEVLVEPVARLDKREGIDLAGLTSVFSRSKNNDIEQLSIPLDRLRKLPPLTEPKPTASEPSNLPREGEIIQAKTPDGWRMVKVTNLGKRTFVASGRYESDTGQCPEYRQLKEWQPLPSPSHIKESAGIKTERGHVQTWQICSVDREQRLYKCQFQLNGHIEQKDIPIDQVAASALVYPLPLQFTFGDKVLMKSPTGDWQEMIFLGLCDQTGDYLLCLDEDDWQECLAKKMGWYAIEPSRVFPQVK
ncbi:AAA family ATPase [Roseofilum sp. Belize Diploria]|uniref:AAA family ATPase n=1 Tax=Roseofilum sp. Belize Diploria TaxID=2821501 RepID=UPI001B0772AF|nr:AAA family ATPase [Roseofilum sp. Belize Diploria]MBP0011300.1 AAA family ATPase [Roseofilum sp. Belize Diploria]